MKIGELAREAGVSVSTVRFCEAQGLMPKPETTDSGYREYAAKDMDRLRLILTAKGQRFPLGLIRNVLSALDIDRSPYRLIRLPSQTPRRERFLAPTIAMQTLCDAEGTDIALPVFLALVLGLRRGEICALRWSDMDRVSGTLRISRQRQRVNGKLIESPLKTRSSARTLRIPQAFVSRIDALGDLDSQYMATFEGKPWNPDDLTKQWNAWEGRPEGFTFHDLRHCAAGLVAAATSNPDTVRAILGHTSIDMTSHYLSEESAMVEDGLSRLGALLNLTTDSTTNVD